MKAITLWQPWASLVAEGVKTIETRGRRSPWHTAIGETIAIHAAQRPVKAFDRVGNWIVEPRWQKCAIGEPEWYALGELGMDHRLVREFPLPLGAVLATCTLTDVVPMVTHAFVEASDGRHERLLVVEEGQILNIVRPDHSTPVWEAVEDQRPFGDFAPGRWALLLDNIVKCAPVPCRGRQGLWTVPATVADNLAGGAA
jgi:hypothetical protein